MLSLDNASVTLGLLKFRFSLRAAAGDIVAILGESGSGKSTLLNLISGFLQVSSGDIRWNDESLIRLAPDKRPVTSLFQANNLFDHLSVAKNVGLGLNPGLKLGSLEWQQVASALGSVGLGGFEGRLPASLSGGEQQRVALARCLIRRKPVLLLDEPFSALDTANRRKMLSLTQDVCRELDLCTLLVTHNPEDAEALGARVLDLVDGRLTERT